jgi:hypothetical protein
MKLAVVLYHDEPYIDFEWSIKDKRGNPLPEGGWLSFPTTIENPQFRLYRTGSIVDPAKDIIPGSNRHMAAVDGGVTVTGSDGVGLAICPLDTPLVSLGEPGLYKYGLDYVPTKPDVYVNLFNSMWSTNFPLWIDGTWSTRVRVWVTQKGSDITRATMEARTPCLAEYADGPMGDLQTSAEGLSLSMKSVVVTSFGPDPYRKGLLLRLWETGGKSGECTIALPKAMNAMVATEVDLRSRPTGKTYRIENGRIKVRFGKFKPVSLLLK